jgi:drug/metabolite transporter (DMT)-like permease
MFAHIVCIGITFSLVMTLMTVSIKMMSAAMAGILFYLLVCFGYLFDYFFLGTHIGWMEILGAVIIVGANVTIGLLIAFKIVY